jgi:hypothetical protein
VSASVRVEEKAKARTSKGERAKAKRKTEKEKRKIVYDYEPQKRLCVDGRDPREESSDVTARKFTDSWASTH